MKTTAQQHKMKTFYVVTKAVIVDAEKGALLLRRMRGPIEFWDTPGGRINGNEDFHQTLLRELAEELPGSEIIETGKLLGVHRVPRDVEGDISLVLLYFEVNAQLSEPVQLSAEHHGYVWVKTQADIPADLEQELKTILHRLLPA